MGRAAETVYGETAILGQDGATEDQLYSERAECGLRGGILQISDVGSKL